MLLCVYRHRFIRAEDLYRQFGHRSRDRLSRRLTWLYRNKFLDRPIAQVDRFGTGQSQSLAYGLDNAGARVVADRFPIDRRLTVHGDKVRALKGRLGIPSIMSFR